MAQEKSGQIEKQEKDVYKLSSTAVKRKLEEAIEHHRNGRLAEAEKLYVQIIESGAENPDSYHLLGLISFHVGDLQTAAALIKRAIQINQEIPDFYYSLGNVFMKSGNSNDAIHCYARAVELNPNNASALNNLAVVLLQDGRTEEAKRYLERALNLQPRFADALNNMGMVLKSEGDFEQAIEYFKRSIELKPDYAEAYNNLGTVLRLLERVDEAIEQYEKAIELKFDYVEAHSNLGNALRDKGKFEISQAKFEQALALNPEHAEAHSNLGNALKDQGRINEALDRYKRAIAIKPDFPVAYFNIGAVYQEIGRFDEAIEYYQQAIKLDPNYAEAHWNHALVMLTLGDFENGWRKYEWRWRKGKNCMHGFDKPLWEGKYIEGKTVLLHCEQGFGDSLQFIRYAPMVKERCSRLVLACPSPLVRLFKSMKCIDDFFTNDSDIPDYDFQAPLMSLPMIFGTVLETIPNKTPYFFPESDEVAKWAKRVGDYKGLKVGLVWAGEPREDNPGAHAVDRRRSMRLSQFAPLASVPGICWFSLQKGKPAEQAKAPPPGMELIDLMDEVNDFADTAAFISNLDLVIGVDTSVIHLAGAMAKPTWVLSRFDGCWRWLVGRDDSPWYPGMRLFRQSEPGEWNSVVERVRDALNDYSKNKR